MGDMPRPRPLYLHREKTRHGRFVWYVRLGAGVRIRLRAEYGTPEFQAEYEAAITGKKAPAKAKAKSGSLQWLYDRYRETGAWSHLSAATRRQRENIFQHVLEKSGAEPYSAIDRSDIEAGKDARRTTPAQARNFLDAMRGLFRWAKSVDHVGTDPTLEVENPSRPKGEGFVVWTEADVARYEARWPIGTRQRVWLDVLLYTGVRRGDVVVIGRQHVRDGVITFRTEKGQGGVEVTIPVLPILATTLAAGPCADLAFICGARGNPLTKESFGNLFKDACVAAGVIVPKKAAHGLRKIGATRAADNGATVHQLMAIFGWTDPKMAALYTEAANRRRLARDAMGMLERTPEERSIPAPYEKVRAQNEN